MLHFMPLLCCKRFCKAMNKDGEGFRYLSQMFPRITDAKIKEGILVVHRSGMQLENEAVWNQVKRCYGEFCW